MLADRRYCYPLTITDFASRYLITAMRSRRRGRPMPLPSLSGSFKEFGLPGRDPHR